MAHTAYTLTATLVSTDGSRTKSEPVSFTDYDLANGTFQNSGNPFFIMPGDGYLREININKTATDTTTYLKLFLGGYDSGQKWSQTELFAGRNPPHLIGAGVFIKGGTMVQFKETSS